MPSVKIDFGKCKDFDELCALLTKLDIHFHYSEDDPEALQRVADFKPYFADEEEEKEN